MATYTPVRLYSTNFLSSSATALYTVPSGKTAVCKQIVLNNTSASATTVTVHVVPSGGAAATSNQVVSQLSIGPYSDIIWSADIPLAVGDAIYALASASNVITATVSGIEIA
jgi:hypothetical protein